MIQECKNPIVEDDFHGFFHRNCEGTEGIKEKYFETHERIPTQPLSLSVLVKKGGALILALAVFVGLVLLAGADVFWTAFLASYGIWFLVDWYDCL